MQKLMKKILVIIGIISVIGIGGYMYKNFKNFSEQKIAEEIFPENPENTLQNTTIGGLGENLFDSYITRDKNGQEYIHFEIEPPREEGNFLILAEKYNEEKNLTIMRKIDIQTGQEYIIFEEGMIE